MPYKRVAVGPEAETKLSHGIINSERFALVDGILTAFEFLFGCWHLKLSRPFTLSGWTYEVCLTCGRKFAYSRAEIGSRVPRQVKVGARSTSVA